MTPRKFKITCVALLFGGSTDLDSFSLAGGQGCRWASEVTVTVVTAEVEKASCELLGLGWSSKVRSTALGERAARGIDLQFIHLEERGLDSPRKRIQADISLEFEFGLFGTEETGQAQ